MTPILFVTLFACSGGEGGPPTYTGSVEVTEVDVAPLIAGRLASIEVRRGDRVAEGDLVFTLATHITEVERQAREGAMEQAQAAIETTEAQAGAAWAQVSLLQRELERMQKLEEAGAGTAQQTSQLSGQLDAARAQALAARKGVAQARAVHRQAESATELVLKKLEESSVYSPIDGVVLSRNREPGEVLAPGMSVATIGDLDHPWLRLYVPLVTVERISVGGAVEVYLDADPERAHQGEISWIASQAEYTPRDILTPEERVKQVFAVDVALQPEPGIHPGIPADAIFLETN